MQRHSSNFRRVSKREPCPICEKHDWCAITGNPITAAICARIESPKRVGDRGAGWLHVVRDDGQFRPTRTRAYNFPAEGAQVINWDDLHEHYTEAIDHERLVGLANDLGLSPDALQAMGIGWRSSQSAWSFPMRGGDGAIRGIRLRLPNGKKIAVKGSRDGLFFDPITLRGDTLFIAEGPTDTAALIDLGFPAAGRPSCRGGTLEVLDLVRRLRPDHVVIVADGDAPGLSGAEALADELVLFAPVRTITPPQGVKDVRAWVNAGAGRRDVSAAIAGASVRKIELIGA